MVLYRRQMRLCLQARSAHTGQLPFPTGQTPLKQGGGGPCWHLGSAWLRVGTYTRGMLSSNVLVPMKVCQSCWLFSHQLSCA